MLKFNNFDAKIQDISKRINSNKFKRLLADPALRNYLFGAAKLTKISDINKYEYSGYGIGFDSEGTFSHPTVGTGANELISVLVYMLKVRQKMF